MKRTIVCLALAALALMPVLQTDDSKGSAANKTVTAEKAKANVQKPASAEKGGCCEKAACSSKETFTKKAVKPAEKGATFLAKK